MDILSQLEEFEGRRSSVYTDSEGWWTIGVGCLVDARKGGGLLPEEINFIRDNRLAIATAKCAAAWPWFGGLSPPRQAVLVLMVYQMGVAGVVGFVRAIAAMRDERWAVAAGEMLDSDWAKQTPARAKRMALQIESGEWQ